MKVKNQNTILCTVLKNHLVENYKSFDNDLAKYRSVSCFGKIYCEAIIINLEINSTACLKQRRVKITPLVLHIESAPLKTNCVFSSENSLTVCSAIGCNIFVKRFIVSANCRKTNNIM